MLVRVLELVRGAVRCGAARAGDRLAFLLTRNTAKISRVKTSERRTTDAKGSGYTAPPWKRIAVWRLAMSWKVTTMIVKCCDPI